MLDRFSRRLPKLRAAPLIVVSPGISLGLVLGNFSSHAGTIYGTTAATSLSQPSTSPGRTKCAQKTRQFVLCITIIIVLHRQLHGPRLVTSRRRWRWG